MLPVTVHAAAEFWSGDEYGVADSDADEVDGGSGVPLLAVADGDGVAHPLIASNMAGPATAPMTRRKALADEIMRPS
jgi:hypothetical protein